MHECVYCVCMDVWGVGVCIDRCDRVCMGMGEVCVCMCVCVCFCVCAWHPHPTCFPTIKSGCSRQQRGCHEMH